MFHVLCACLGQKLNALEAIGRPQKASVSARDQVVPTTPPPPILKKDLTNSVCLSDSL